MNHGIFFTRWISLIVVALGASVSMGLPADGGFFFLQTEPVAQTRQELLLAFHGEDGIRHATYVIASDYTGSASDFAWVLPIPAEPVGAVITLETSEEYREGDTRGEPLFAKLHHLTAPTFIGRSGAGLITGCTCSADYGAGDADTELGTIEIVREGTAGILAYQVIRSDRDADVTTWLTEQGYGVPQSAKTILDRYALDGWLFLGLQVSRRRL